MTERHKITRQPPQNQRPPHGKGWSRHSDVPNDATLWKMWAPIPNGYILQTQVIVTDLEISLAGRWAAAMRLREARREMRLALSA